MRTPENTGEFSELISQVIFEFDELAICSVEDLEDELHDYAHEFESMSLELKKLLEQVECGTDFVNTRGLAFMNRAKTLRPIIPFYSLVELLDTVCRKGLRGG